MTGKRHLTLVPQYMHQFSCIGSACSDSCCIGWRVSIDKETYKKYRRVKHPDLKPLFQEKVTRNRSNPSKSDYAKIKMNKDRRCPFLNKDKLCRIQLALGEEYLSATCKFYPRTINKINGVLEISATVSCPEAARLILFNPEVMEFDQQTGLLQSGVFVHREVDTKKPVIPHRLHRYFWELRIFTIQVIQNRQFKLWERLIFLGLFYKKVEEYLEQDRSKEILELIARYTNMINEGIIRDSIAGIPVQTTIQMKLLKELADERFFQGINSPRYFQCFKEFLRGVNYQKGLQEEEIGEQYSQAYAEYYQPYMQDREYILENYLVNYIFKNIFPLGNKNGPVFDEYLMFVIHYALIKMHLIGMAAFHQGLGDELVLKLIQSFAKTVEHNAIYLFKVKELLRANNLATMAYAAIMIKN